MKRCLFTVLPTEEDMNRSSGCSSRPDSLRCAAQRVLRVTAQAWVLPPPAAASVALAFARAAALSRQRDADRLAC